MPSQHISYQLDKSLPHRVDSEPILEADTQKYTGKGAERSGATPSSVILKSRNIQEPHTSTEDGNLSHRGTEDPLPFASGARIPAQRKCGNDCWSSFVRLYKVTTGSVRLAAEYVWADNQKNKRSFFIGITTVFLVVAFLSLIQNSLERSSVLFLKTAEDQVGQVDLLLTPAVPITSDSSNNPPLAFLNYTQVNQTLAPAWKVTGSAPRWILPAEVYRSLANENASSSSANASSRVDISHVYVVVMDSELEESMGLGPTWPYRSLGDYEVSITASALRSLKVRPQRGEKVTVRFPLVDMMKTLSENSQPSSNTTGTNQTDTSVTQPNNFRSSNVTIAEAFFPFLLLRLDPTQRARLLGNTTRDENGNYVFPSTLALDLIETQYLQSSMEFTVVDSIESSFGKIPAALGNVAVMEMKPMERLVQRQLRELASNPFASMVFDGMGLDFNASALDIDNFALKDYAMSIWILMQNRLATYAKSEDDRVADIIGFSNHVATYLGYDFPATCVDALSRALELTSILKTFLDQTFFTVIAVLSMLASLLIYSLLLSDVENKTFEYGMLRMLGLRQDLLMLLLLFQSMYFAIPGIAIGLLVAFVIYVPIEHVISEFSGTPMSITFTMTALLLGIILGTVLPVIGMIAPIRRSLTRTLRDSLDIYHNVVFETNVNIQKLENIGLSLNETILSILLVVIGFVVYYLLPMFFTYNDMSMFFLILTGILLGMVVGQVLLGQIVQHTLEKLSLLLIMWGQDRKLIHIVKKNLVSHIAQNHKTALMFTLCLSYIIFSATMFALQSKAMSQAAEWTLGADVSVAANEFSSPLPEDDLRSFLTSYSSRAYKAEIIVDWTFVTFPLNAFDGIGTTNVQGLSSITAPTVLVYGLEESFLTTTLDTYYVPSQVDESVGIDRHLSDGKPDVVQRLSENIDLTKLEDVKNPENVLSPQPSGSDLSRTPEFNFTLAYTTSIPVLVSEVVRNLAYVDVKSKLVLGMEYKPVGSAWSSSTTYICKPVAFLQKLPSFPSITRLQTSNTPLLVSMKTYEKLLTDGERLSGMSVKAIAGVDVPKWKLLVKLRADATSLQVESFFNDLNSVLADSSVEVSNLRAIVESTQSAADFITLVFHAVAVIAFIFSFFVLWLSFSANIRENSWEFGVLRAVGLDAKTVVRIYVYESVSIILSSLVVGSIAGIFTAITVTIQGNLFTEMPFSFEFPTFLFFIIAIGSILVAIAGSYLPASEFREKQIAVALKGL